jgi:hypothetical protein
LNADVNEGFGVAASGNSSSCDHSDFSGDRFTIASFPLSLFRWFQAREGAVPPCAATQGVLSSNDPTVSCEHS